MWVTVVGQLECLIGFHDWEYLRSHLWWGEDIRLRRCRRCGKKQRRFKNYGKDGRYEWLNTD